MNLNQIIKKLLTIKKMGFVKTHRANDTGIGKTLEDLLGIEENNLRLPDVGDVELKTKRIDSQSMLTLATKSPEPKGINKVLFEKYKYKDVDGYYNLHSTVYGSMLNSQGFKIKLNKDKLVLGNRGRINCYWPISMFQDVLVSKSNIMRVLNNSTTSVIPASSWNLYRFRVKHGMTILKTLFNSLNIILLVFAKTKGERKTLNEQFHFVEAYLLSDLDTNKFKKAIEKDMLKVDIRIGVYRTGDNKGKYHDHGTGFRINKRDFLKLFNSYKQLI